MKIENLDSFLKIIDFAPSKTFDFFNFGCRVNAAETHLLSQILIDQGFSPSHESPGLFLVNTCSITQKGEYESLAKVRQISNNHPNSIIIVTGCAHTENLDTPNTYIFDNKTKEDILDPKHLSYSQSIKDKFSKSKKYLLKIQSGCTHFCSYCTVPYRRQYLWSLKPTKAIDIVNNAVKEGYEELIITGVNIDQYQYGLSNLLKLILKETSIKTVSFGSIPINSIDKQFITLFSDHSQRFNPFLHIPIQSGSNKILKLMNRPYTKAKVVSLIKQLKLANSNLKLGTDIIVGFPGESDKDFNETQNLLEQIKFHKIHTFRFSPRPQTLAAYYWKKYPKIPQIVINQRSKIIRSLQLNAQTKLPSHQTL